MQRWSAHLTRMTVGIGLIAIGVLALTAPFAVGTWSLQFLGLPMLAVAIAELYTTVTSPLLRTRPASYVTGILATAAALVLYLSPSLVASGVIAILVMLLAADGAVKTGQAIFRPPPGTTRSVAIVNGLSSIILALIAFWIWKKLGLQIALGVAVAGYTTAAGWRQLVAPASEPAGAETPDAANIHADRKLKLGSHELFAKGLASLAASRPIVARTELYWLTVAGAVLFVIHLARMDSSDTWLGLISPVVATAGDVADGHTAGSFADIAVAAWLAVSDPPAGARSMAAAISGQDARLQPFPRRLVREWTDARLSFSASLRNARTSLPSAAGLASASACPSQCCSPP